MALINGQVYLLIGDRTGKKACLLPVVIVIGPDFPGRLQFREPDFTHM